MTFNDVSDPVNDLCEEMALAIGGMAAVHDLDDELVWDLINRLETTRSKILRQLNDRDSSGQDPPGMGSAFRPHPAIENFLLKLRGVWPSPAHIK